MGKSKAFVVQPKIVNHYSGYNINYLLEEAINLTLALDVEVVGSDYNNIREINPATLLTKGFLESLKNNIELLEIDLLIVNYDITAIQQRNLEQLLNCKVLDRNGLIINIFSKRARSKEGKLQAELASLIYQKSRLVKAWSHLERQRGGGGFIGGPGETQKELDKRIITEKIFSLKKQLEKSQQNREIQSASRKKKDYKIIALVGYTNAGKSTLFNAITGSNIFAKDLLFATLDTTLRTIDITKKEKAILLDTVGFVSNLPHQLIEAFKSTLDEVKEADLILHVIDSNQENIELQIESVKEVLKELGINELEYQNKVIEVYNKIDLFQNKQFSNKEIAGHPIDNNVYKELLQSTQIAGLKHDLNSAIDYFDLNIFNKNNDENFYKVTKVAVSAKENIALNKLKEKIFDYFSANKLKMHLELDYLDYDILMFLYKYSSIINKSEKDNKISIDFYISKDNNEILQSKLDPNYHSKNKEPWLK